MNRSKKAFLNMSSQLLVQLVTAICGFIVPKLILERFGSELNGMVTSISQFLGIIALMESGFGGVAKTAFYKPLAAGDHRGISGVFNATEAFFHKVAFVFLAYCIGLSFAFPLIRGDAFDYWFTMTLVLIIGINSFMQYYFGISYTILLNADQRGYFSAFLQVITVILNAVLTVILLNMQASIHVVKLISAFVFIIKPIVVNLYGRYRYRIDRRVPKDQKSIAQKWDNLGQSVALYIHTKTAAILITIFLNYAEVSIYSVYSLITTSLSSVLTSISTGFVSGLGNIYANREKENFHRVFSLYEFVSTTTSFLFYTIALVLMIPFVRLYTANLTDADYIRPLFGTLLVLAELMYCVRLPYYYMITNAGHFRQIKFAAYVEAGLNIVISLCLVRPLGIVGLAIGMLVAMTYRSVSLIRYCAKYITEQSSLLAFKRILINAGCMLLSIGLCRLFSYTPESFFGWLLYALPIGLVSLLAFGLVNYLFYREDFATLMLKLRGLIRRS